jgi:DNA-binding XRE family transcriptional regulator
MKQLFIVPASTGEFPAAGSLKFVETVAMLPTELSAAPTTNAIEAYYGRGDNSNAISMLIDYNTVSVVKMEKGQDGTNAKFTVTCPTPEKGLNYTVTVAKKGVVFHERNLFSATETYRTSITTAEKLAESLGKQLSEIAPNLINIDVTVSGATVVIEGKDYEDINVVIGDDLFSTGSVEQNTQFFPPMCDKNYVKNLASVCAQNRGFDNTYADGVTIYPGYPMAVDADEYVIYDLHFANPRVASRTRDEAVWQDLFIAVAKDNSDVQGKIETIFAEKLKK